MKSEEIEEKLIEIEAKLLEQEHRPFSLIKNYLGRNKYKKDDKRRISIKAALFWKLLFSQTAVIATGGIIGVFSVYFLYKQTDYIKNQNKLIENQNYSIQKQTFLIESGRRSSQVFIMGDVLSDINKELNNEKNTKRILSNALVGRIISLSRAMKPYKFLEGDSLIKKPLSPERGQLLISLLESKIDSAFFRNRILTRCEFTNSDLSNSDLSGEYFSGVNFKGSNFSNSNFRKATFEGVNFNESNLVNVDFNKSSLQFSSFRHANLEGSDFNPLRFDGTDFEGANLKKAIFNTMSLSDCFPLFNCKSLDSVFVNKGWLFPKNYSQTENSKRVLFKYKIDSILQHSNWRKYFLVKK